MAPSRTMGAVMPRRRSAPTKVVVFQWPWGTGARQRSPRRARPWRRAILVEAPVSSMKTSRSGSKSSWASNQGAPPAQNVRPLSLARVRGFF
jgi:hypothetical protein